MINEILYFFKLIEFFKYNLTKNCFSHSIMYLLIQLYFNIIKHKKIIFLNDLIIISDELLYRYLINIINAPISIYICENFILFFISNNFILRLYNC